MTADRNSVVREIRPLDEDEFHAAFMVMLSGLNRAHSPAKVAQALGYTTKRQLANLANGSLPNLRAFYNLLTLDTKAHDAVDADYGLRKVPRDALCTSDAAAAPALVAALHKVIEAEADGEKTHTELLGMENELREAGKAIEHLLARIADIRKPKAVRS